MDPFHGRSQQDGSTPHAALVGKPDGATPLSSLTLDGAGNLYGATSGGGSAGHGVVFELSHSANGCKQTVLHNFAGKPDGATAFSAPVFDSAGNLFGTTYYGGNNNQWTVYELSPAAGATWTEQVLYAFHGDADGANPSASVSGPRESAAFVMR